MRFDDDVGEVQVGVPVGGNQYVGVDEVSRVQRAELRGVLDLVRHGHGPHEAGNGFVIDDELALAGVDGDDLAVQVVDPGLLCGRVAVAAGCDGQGSEQKERKQEKFAHHRLSVQPVCGRGVCGARTGRCYNAGMGQMLDEELVQWLAADRRVLTASERTARALTAAWNQLRQSRGEQAWAAPRVEPLQQFLVSLWHRLGEPERVVLTPLQEQALWSAVVGGEAELATTLEPSRHRLGRLAMEAHGLIAGYAPEFLDPRKRLGWQRDQAAFSRWLSALDERCREDGWISSARLAGELVPLVEALAVDERDPLLLVGFDRLLPVERRLLDAWGEWREQQASQGRARCVFYEAAAEDEEIAACVRWVRQQLDANPAARLMVIAQNQQRLRGRLERSFAEALAAMQTGERSVEFSRGVPLATTALVRSARAALALLSSGLEEHALDVLLADGHLTADGAEQAALGRRMRRLRARGRERAEWTLDAFLSERCDVAVPESWRERWRAASLLLVPVRNQAQTPMAWAELVPKLLRAVGWPGGRALSSAEYQLARRLEEALDAVASLGAVTRRMSWRGFLGALDSILEETLYTPESESGSVLVAGAAETAGLVADAIWFLGATEDGWPAAGSAHPLLPLGMQRDAAMPHAQPRVDWDLAETMTRRLVSSAETVLFSYARLEGGAEVHPSRLAIEFAGSPVELASGLRSGKEAGIFAEVVEDGAALPYSPTAGGGGSELIRLESACAMKAFLTVRLGAKSWQEAEAGLTAAQRGTLLHGVLHAIWSGPPEGIRTQADLDAIADVRGFVGRHVEHIFAARLPAAARELMPQRYLDLEKQRLQVLVVEWLALEVVRRPFVVEATEVAAEAVVEGVPLHLRLDRVDRLADGTLLIVDYKTGDVSPTSWDGERPEDPQLPLYAVYGRTEGQDRAHGQDLGGLVFARVRAGEHGFAGRVGQASDVLLPGLKSTHALVKTPLTAEMLMDWRDEIARLAREFVAGMPERNPRTFPAVCDGCELAAVCRVRDFPPDAEQEETSEDGLDG